LCPFTALFYLSKQVLEASRYHSLGLEFRKVLGESKRTREPYSRALHGVGLATAGGAIGEDGGVISLKHLQDVVFDAELFVKLLLRCLFIRDVIISELFAVNSKRISDAGFIFLLRHLVLTH
jgi:hypothetical protein